MIYLVYGSPLVLEVTQSKPEDGKSQATQDMSRSEGTLYFISHSKGNAAKYSH